MCFRSFPNFRFLRKKLPLSLLLSACCIAIADPVRSMLGADSTEVIPAEEFQNPYITDGLVAMWDGEWNAGFGIHDPTIVNEWHDIVGGKTVTALAGTTMFDENCLVAEGAVLSSTLGSLVSLLNTGKFTIEWLQYHSDSRGYVFGNVRSQGSSLFEIWDNNGLGMYLRLYGYDNYGNVGYKKGAVRYAETHMAYTVDADDGVYGYVNGLFIKKSASAFTPSVIRTEATSFALIGNNTYTWTRFTGQVYFIRLYNRALTEDEILHNYAVDAERFGL